MAPAPPLCESILGARDYRRSDEESSVTGEPTFFLLENVPWPEIGGSGAAVPGVRAQPRALVQAAQKSGARRKSLARGEGGFLSQYSEFPTGFTVPLHSHDRDEMLVVLGGTATMLGGGPTLGAHDSMVLIG